MKFSDIIGWGFVIALVLFFTNVFGIFGGVPDSETFDAGRSLPLIFALFSIPWFIGAIVSTLLIMWALGEDSGMWAGCALVGFFGLTSIFGDFNIFAWLWSHPGTLAIGIVCYIAVAIVWCFFKWFMWSTRKDREFNDALDVWLRSEKGLQERPSPFSEDLQEEWTDYCLENRMFTRNIGSRHEACYIVDPQTYAWANKLRIGTWACWWPFSMLETALFDFIKEFGIWVWRRCGKHLDKISQRVFAESKTTLVSAEEQKKRRKEAT